MNLLLLLAALAVAPEAADAGNPFAQSNRRMALELAVGSVYSEPGGTVALQIPIAGAIEGQVRAGGTLGYPGRTTVTSSYDLGLRIRDVHDEHRDTRMFFDLSVALAHWEIAQSGAAPAIEAYTPGVNVGLGLEFAIREPHAPNAATAVVEASFLFAPDAGRAGSIWTGLGFVLAIHQPIMKLPWTD